MKLIDYTLPEFVFLDGNSHLGDSLADRTVLQHVRSYTILEVIALDEVDMSSFTQPTYEFKYKNSYGVTERHMFILHFSLAHEAGMPVGEALQEIFAKCSQWYCDYLAWEDRNLDNDNKPIDN